MGSGVGGGEKGVNEILAEEAGVEATGSLRSIGTSSIKIGDDSGNSGALMVIINIKNTQCGSVQTESLLCTWVDGNADNATK